MNSAAILPRTGQPETRQLIWRRRMLAIAATMAAGVAFWAVVVLGFGETVHGPAFGDALAPEVGLSAVVTAIAMSTVAGLVLLVALERWTSRPTRTWTTIAIGFTLVSLGGPLSGSGVSSIDRAVLVALHLITAAVYITMIRRTTSDRWEIA